MSARYKSRNCPNCISLVFVDMKQDLPLIYFCSSCGKYFYVDDNIEVAPEFIKYEDLY